MKVLVVNDDGIESIGLKLLVEKLIPYAEEIMVVAPTYEQSAQSHSLTVRRGIKLTNHEPLLDGIKTYSIDGSPADCVKFAYNHLKYDFDIVFSGVNNGLNLGDDIIYSGTVAGASEAAFMHRKGIAFSSPKNDFSGFVKYFDQIMGYLLKSKVYQNSLVLNINIPTVAKGINITHQGHHPYNTEFVLKDDNLFYSIGKYDEIENDENSDIFSFNAGYISITPVTVNRTDLTSFKDNHELIKF